MMAAGHHRGIFAQAVGLRLNSLCSSRRVRRERSAVCSWPHAVLRPVGSILGLQVSPGPRYESRSGIDKFGKCW